MHHLVWEGLEQLLHSDVWLLSGVAGRALVREKEVPGSILAMPSTMYPWERHVTRLYPLHSRVKLGT